VPRLALAASLCVLVACAAPPRKADDQPLQQTCAEVARLMENGSTLSDKEKREAVEKLKPLVFHWKVKILATSDETSRGELANGMAFDVECDDRPNVNDQGIRYLFTLYFEKRVPELAALSHGAQITVDGQITRYEGQAAFAAHVRNYQIH
jgi:hypothetical protein